MSFHSCYSLAGSNGSDEEPAPPPKPARPQFSISPTGSTPNLSVHAGGPANSNVSSLPHQWSGAANLPGGHINPEVKGQGLRAQEHFQSTQPPSTGTHIEYQLQNYFPSSGYMQVNCVSSFMQLVLHNIRMSIKTFFLFQLSCVRSGWLSCCISLTCPLLFIYILNCEPPPHSGLHWQT